METLFLSSERSPKDFRMGKPLGMGTGTQIGGN